MLEHQPIRVHQKQQFSGRFSESHPQVRYPDPASSKISERSQNSALRLEAGKHFAEATK